MHGFLKNRFYDTTRLIAVNGESVVVRSGADEVDKFMFRYPSNMALDVFHGHVSREIGEVTTHLAGIALPTSVAIKPARIFRNPHTEINAVAQTQALLDLDLNAELTPKKLLQLTPADQRTDRTARDLERLVRGSKELREQQGLYPDIANAGGNLRRNVSDGAVTLIDVMPFYQDGTRLIGSAPPNIISHVQQNLASYEAFVGQYGA